LGDFLQGHLFVSLAGASRMMDLNAEYLAAGANRHPAAADWDENGILAFGADRNIALWRPQVSSHYKGISHMVQTSHSLWIPCTNINGRILNHMASLTC
jgi:hypothetical protein